MNHDQSDKAWRSRSQREEWIQEKFGTVRDSREENLSCVWANLDKRNNGKGTGPA